jgi:hypothetical protein
MYLFTRESTLAGGQRRPLQFAMEITELVNRSIGDLEVHLWSTLFGRPAGTFSWNVVVDSRAQLSAATAGLIANDEYQSMLERGMEFAGAGTATDTLRQLVHPSRPGDGTTAVGNFAEAITATSAPGQIAKVMAWGVEIAQLVTGIIEVPVTFWADAYGTFGQVTWIVVYPDAAAVDAANEQLNSNADYLRALDSDDDLFVPGSGSRALFTRLA